MSFKTARDIINEMERKYGNIKEVFIFGGEPLLSLSEIEKICAYLNEDYPKKGKNIIPQVLIQTNGTLIDKRFISLVKKYDLSITISLDGPKEINDTNRVYPSGKGTYDDIRNGISLLQEHSIPFGIECTYTIQHFEAGITLHDLYEYFIHFDPMSIQISRQLIHERDKIIEFINSFVKQSVNLFSNTCALGKGWIKNFDVRQRLSSMSNCSERFCGGGINKLAIDSNGDVYPCHIISGFSIFRMGHFLDENYSGSVFPKKEILDECKKCSIIDNCNYCPAQMFLESNMEYKPRGDICFLLKSFTLLARNELENIM
jgi:uncharacterized protein